MYLQRLSIKIYNYSVDIYAAYRPLLDPGLTSSPSLYQIPSHSSLLSLHSSSAASPIMTLQSESPAWKWTPGSEDISANNLENANSKRFTFVHVPRFLFCCCWSTMTVNSNIHPWLCTHLPLFLNSFFVHFCQYHVFYKGTMLKCRFNIMEYHFWRYYKDVRRATVCIWTLKRSSWLTCSSIVLIVFNLMVHRVGTAAKNVITEAFIFLFGYILTREHTSCLNIGYAS